MTTPTFPVPPQQPQPGAPNQTPPAGYPQSGQPPQAAPPAPAKRGNALTSKPVIGIAALVVGLILGAGTAGGGKQATTTAPLPTVTVTATETATYEATADAEPGDEASGDASSDSSAPDDTSYKYGQTVGFSYEDVEISVRIESPKRSTNMFDKDNLEARLKVCNKGSDTIDEMSAEGLGLYAEDSNGGQYTLLGAYRSPEFPIYDYDSSTLRAGKCRTGWISFEDGRKAVRIATEVEDSTYTWSKSGA